MDISTRKKVLGTAVSIALIGVVAPAAFWALSMGLDGVFGPTRLVGEPWSSIVCAASALIGVFWILWSWSYLLFVGQGLPLEVFGRALHPTQMLVTTGPYAYTRNPTVFGLLFILLAVAFFRGTSSGFVLLPVVGFLTWVYLVVFEETGLAKRFGADYQDYREAVPLLFPRLSAYARIPSVE